MNHIDKWWESQKNEWKEEFEKTKELGTVDVEILDVMSTLLDGIKIRERSKNKKEVRYYGNSKNIQKQK